MKGQQMTQKMDKRQALPKKINLKEIEWFGNRKNFQ